MTVREALLVGVTALALCGCRTGVPVLDRGERPATQSGTIAGHVRSSANAAVVSRLVRAVAVATGEKFETTTNNAGTYTLKVPPGRYRLEVELRDNERVTKQPDLTDVNPSDLDPDRDFVIDVVR